MRTDYSSFLEYRAVRRRLAAQFARPHGLLLHALVLVTTMTMIWLYGNVWRLWFHRDNLLLPTLMGMIWSLLLAAQSIRHYRRSPAMVERREQAVDDAMRRFIEQHGEQVDHESLYAMHRQLEDELERQGRWSRALLAFGLVNAVSWSASAFNAGTSWPFQMTLPLAITLIGGIYAFASWQAGRREARAHWFVRLPLGHSAAFGAGIVALWLAASYRLMNPWDAETLMKGWGLVLLAHIVWSVIVWPPIQRWLPAKRSWAQPAKRAPGSRLVLADDGEVLDSADQEAEQFRASML